MEDRFHIIGVVGLGLIGGSLARAIQERTECIVYGYDTDPNTIEKALCTGAIDRAGVGLEDCGTVFVALYPKAAVNFVRARLADFRSGALIVDLCGIKQYVCCELTPICEKKGLPYIGAHPMAGREQSGFDNTKSDLFEGSSLILTPGCQPDNLIASLEEFMREAAGFSRIVCTTPEHHDQMIAYTSQLAHVLSSAYIQNPLARDFCGFTGGSFQDLTRVARLNSAMWGELFLRNRGALMEQIDILMHNLQEYRESLQNNDLQQLASLMDAGTEIKNELLSRESLD